jgi:hypothetical protein
MKLDYRLVVLYDPILHVELRAMWENLAQLGESALPESLLAAIVTGGGECPSLTSRSRQLPPFEERRFVADLKFLKDLANTV